MKTIKTQIIVLAGLLVSSFAYASGSVQLNLKPAGDESAYVEILKESGIEVEIEVKNRFNEVLFNKKLMTPVAEYRRKYNFSGLEDGRYHLSVTSGNEINDTWFNIERGVLSVEGNRKSIEPYIQNEGNIFKMSYLNFQMEEMGLYVYDGSSLLYQKKLEPVFAVNQGLDLSKLIPGTYQVVFANEHNHYEYVIEIN